MAGVYCDRCQTNVQLEQDGESCSNCGRVLIIRAPTPRELTEVLSVPIQTPARRPTKRVRRPTTKPAA